MNLPKVSIIVTTYNEEKNIKTLILSCFSQNYKNIELILVDSTRATDKTLEVAKNLGVKTYKYGKERSAQRNYGASKSKGEYVLILDADMKLSPSVVSDCVKSGFSALVIPEKSYGQSYWAKCKALERNCYIGDPQIEAPRLFRKDIFIKAGGYDTKMVSGEDWDLRERVKKLGKTGRIDKFIYHNEGHLSLFGDLKKKLYYSKESDSFIKNNVSNTKQVFNFIFRPAYFRNWRMLISDPVHLPGFIIMKTLEFVVGAAVIVSKPIFWHKITKI